MTNAMINAVPANASTNPLTPRFSKALDYAFDVHKDQVRKGASPSGTPVPYIAHLLGVTAIVLEAGGTEDEAIAALLHDAVEDQGGINQLRAITLRFGLDVADIVYGCTDGMPDQSGNKAPWRERKENYIAHLPEASGSTRLVSAADKLYNVRTLIADYQVVGEQLWERFRGGRDTRWYYVTITGALRDSLQGSDPAGLEPLVEELEREVRTFWKLTFKPCALLEQYMKGIDNESTD